MISFELHFQVEPAHQAEFEQAYAEVFAPALSKQKGFRSSRLLRSYAPQLTAELEAAATEYQYQVDFTFESEAARRAWATSADHDVAWPKLSRIATKFFWRGYDLLAAQ
jgi:heme-degrading monooxygenase HmoA